MNWFWKKHLSKQFFIGDVDTPICGSSKVECVTEAEGKYIATVFFYIITL